MKASSRSTMYLNKISGLSHREANSLEFYYISCLCSCSLLVGHGALPILMEFYSSPHSSSKYTKIGSAEINTVNADELSVLGLSVESARNIDLALQRALPEAVSNSRKLARH